MAELLWGLTARWAEGMHMGIHLSTQEGRRAAFVASPCACALAKQDRMQDRCRLCALGHADCRIPTVPYYSRLQWW